MSFSLNKYNNNTLVKICCRAILNNMKGLTGNLDLLMITVVLIYEKQSVVDLDCTFLTLSFFIRGENLTISCNEVIGIELIINY